MDRIQMIELAIPASMCALWTLYLAVMNLARARDAGTLSRPAYYLGLPLLYVGLLIDMLMNIFIATILFLELPQE